MKYMLFLIYFAIPLYAQEAWLDKVPVTEIIDRSVSNLSEKDKGIISSINLKDLTFSIGSVSLAEKATTTIESITHIGLHGTTEFEIKDKGEGGFHYKYSAAINFNNISIDGPKMKCCAQLSLYYKGKDELFLCVPFTISMKISENSHHEYTDLTTNDKKVIVISK